MNTTASTTHVTPALPTDAPASAKQVFRLLSKLQHGRLDIEWPDGGHSRFPASAVGHDDTPGVRAGAEGEQEEAEEKDQARRLHGVEGAGVGSLAAASRSAAWR